jgi:branched-chain amino acid aminotransferase
MQIDANVLAELEKLGRKSRVFLSMPYVPGLTPEALEKPGRWESCPTEEGLERRHGIFKLAEAGLSPLDHGGLYGDAVFEGVLVQHGRIFVMKEHLHRWWASADKMCIRFPYRMADLAEWIVRAVREVGFGPDEKGYLRPVLTRGFGNLGINPAKCIAPTIYVICSTITLYPAERYDTGIELSVARRYRRAGRTIVDPNVKSNNYLNNINGLLESRGQGTLETLMLTAEGNVAEATADNLFLVRHQPGWESDPSKVLIETPVRDYCLVGITRNLVMQEARAAGYTVVERGDLLPMDLVGPAREVFMTGTGCGIMPVVGLEGVPVGDHRPGPVTRSLLARVRARMTDPAYALSFNATRSEIEEYLAAPLAVNL